MTQLSIDIETYSSVDLSKSGVYKYVSAEDFKILLFAYCFDNGPVSVVDTSDKSILPIQIKEALFDPTVLKTAWNANFEITCLSTWLRRKLPNDQWECTMVKSAMLGLPMSLAQTSAVLKLEEGKDARGKALIRYFTMPCKPTNTNGMRTRNLPEHDPEKWQQFKDYCAQDVVVERAIGSKISFFQIPANEKKLWQLDQRINDTGILIDSHFVEQAIIIDEAHRNRLTKEIVNLTNLDNPNSPAQLKDWLSNETGASVTSLTKEAVPLLLEKTDCQKVSRVLEIRQEMSKTSVKKYEAMVLCKGADDRARGLFQYGGASRTMRWAGRLIQMQNLPQNHLFDLDLARALVRVGDMEMLELLFGNVPDTLSQLVRTAFIAPKGSRFIVCDFSAIEARVIAWLAGEKWRMDVFHTHGKIYEASAAQMFKVPIETVTKGSPLRQKGKVAELALGFQGGVNALTQMGALKMGITEDELPELVSAWRNANPAIVRLWKSVEVSAMLAVEGNPAMIAPGIRFSTKRGMLLIELPSGRSLCYQKISTVSGMFGKNALAYLGMNQTTKQWQRQDTYGGKLVENIVQAIARDCLAYAMLKLDEAGYKIVMHVHDEVVLEVPEEKGSLAEVRQIMSVEIPWAKGLPLTADGYETNYYKKD